MNNIAFFYAYKGDSEPKMMAFSGGVDETKLAMQLVEDVFPNAPSYVTATYGYTIVMYENVLKKILLLWLEKT